MDLNLAYLLIVVGLGLMASELFFPTGGILFLVGGISIAGGVIMTFLYGDTWDGIKALVGVGIGVPIAVYGIAVLWPRTPMGRRLQLGPDEDATIAKMPVNVELEVLRGRHGRALSDLRPAGAVEFDGKRVDVVGEGPMISAGSWVRCIDVRAGRVVVRQVEQTDLENIDLEDIGR